MEKITIINWDFEKNPKFTGRYLKTGIEGHTFADQKGMQFNIPHTIHTDFAATVIESGQVCLIEKTQWGHDVYVLDALESEKWLKEIETNEQDKV